MLQGLMQNAPLVITAILRCAQTQHATREIVSVTADNPDFRYTYAEAFARAAQLAHALKAMGMRAGDRVATLAWNDHRHFELYYGISCSGGVCHTVNPRLFADQIAYILNHAEDRWVFVDPAFVGILEALQPQLKHVEGFIVLSDELHMPATSLPDAISYESLLVDHPGEFDWPALDEDAASSLCYTSGTTGQPKGVLFSHRTTVLHAMSIAMPDVANLSQRNCVLPLVPMFHVNAWGMPYVLPMVGAKLVLPGPKMGDGGAVCTLIEKEGVDFSLGVPTVWLALLDYLDRSGKNVPSLQRICIGGAACPAVLLQRFETEHKVTVHHGWGMTEMSPIGAYNTLKAGADKLEDEALLALRLRQGRAPFGVEMKIVDEQNNSLPWDGVAAGALKVRGGWVCRAYYKDDTPILDEDGWFDTGDVATIDADGFMQITDRSKDIIKSGGEWISSIELENTAVDHPAVAEAAVIGVAHPKWQERPLLLVVLQAGQSASRDELLAWYEGKVASWWVPDDVVIVPELPHTATGKLQKTALREQFAAYTLPAEEL